ncbi:MAG: sigma factor, partial [Oscillospiraceae bacterium]
MISPSQTGGRIGVLRRPDAQSKAAQTEKFNRLYERYSRGLLGLTLSILRDQAAAEDAVQNAFVCVFKNLDKIDEQNCSKTRAYLIVISRREAFKL